MKSIIIKPGAAIAIIAVGLITAATTASATSDINSDNSPPGMHTVHKVGHATAHIAKTTWHGSKMVARTAVHDSKGIAQSAWDGSKRAARTVVYSPVIAYEVVRGERPLFPHYAASHQGSRQQIALTGHRHEMKSRMQGSEASRHNEQPPI
jgi:hypothetical protein